jgi:hypothetical protein
MAAGKKKAARKKTARKKTTPKKAARKKAARKKTAPKKAARKKAARKKTAPKKAARKKTARVKTARRKEVAAPAPSVPGDGSQSATSAAPPAASAQDPESVKVAASTPTRIGIITHYFGKVGAGVISLESGKLRVGDMIHVRGHTTDFYERVNRMEIDHVPVEIAKPGQSVGVEITQRVREHDEVFRVSD